MNKFTEISPLEWKDNVFERIGKEWMLISAGDRHDYNMMTASWGGVGVLWNVDVSMAFVRPQRYTYEFMEKYPTYALSFLGKGFKRALQLCGSTSGRDTDKAKEAGLTPVFDAPAPYFAESELVLVCRKMYAQDIDPNGFIDHTLPNFYEHKDYHRLYVGEIIKVLKKID